MPDKRIDHYGPGTFGDYKGHSVIRDDGTVEHFENDGSLIDGVTDGRYAGRSVIRREKASHKEPTGSGGGGGGDLGEMVGGGLVWLIIAPLYVMFLLGKGIILSLEQRNIRPLLEGIAQSCACIGIVSTVFGVLYAFVWWLGGQVGVHGDQISGVVMWNELFWGIALAAWALFALLTWVARRNARRDEAGLGRGDVVAANAHPFGNAKKSTGKGNLVGWVVGLSFAFVAPKILVAILIVLFPESANYHLSSNPFVAPVILFLFFLFPIGPSILLGRFVARHVNAK